jgi:hypothetical protein
MLAASHFSFSRVLLISPFILALNAGSLSPRAQSSSAKTVGGGDVNKTLEWSDYRRVKSEVTDCRIDSPTSAPKEVAKTALDAVMGCNGP